MGKEKVRPEGTQDPRVMKTMVGTLSFVLNGCVGAGEGGKRGFSITLVLTSEGCYLLLPNRSLQQLTVSACPRGLLRPDPEPTPSLSGWEEGAAIRSSAGSRGPIRACGIPLDQSEQAVAYVCRWFMAQGLLL